MSVSSPFILRPIATSLLGIAVMLGGMLGYLRLPISSLPQVDFPTIQVTTQFPAASPDTVLVQRLSELSGVGRVTIQGGIRPAVRIQVDLARLANYGISLEDVRTSVVAANSAGPKGSLDGAHQAYTIAGNDQIMQAEAYRSIVIAYRNGAPVMLKDVAEIVDGLE